MVLSLPLVAFGNVSIVASYKCSLFLLLLFLLPTMVVTVVSPGMQSVMGARVV